MKTNEIKEEAVTTGREWAEEVENGVSLNTRGSFDSACRNRLEALFFLGETLSDEEEEFFFEVAEEAANKAGVEV